MKLVAEMKALFSRKDSRIHREFFKGKDSTQVDLSKLDLNKEEDRRVSFTRNNWQNNFISYEKLALFGFYFYKKPDYVRCKFCRVTLSNFEPEDDPLVEHLKFSRNCPLILRRETLNTPIDYEELERVLPRVSYDECPSDEDEVESSAETSNLKFPEFLLESTRLQTFTEWPKSLNQKPVDLAAAGFFYNGTGDKVICFHCGLGLRDWDPEDNVWLEHEKHMPNCEFLKMNQEILDKNRIKSRKSSLEKMEETFQDAIACDKTENLCKICFMRRASLVFLPCRHVCSCGTCVYGLNNICPICREPIKEKISLYFS